MLLEDVVDVGVPPVKDGIPHGGGRVPNYSERLQMSVIRVVNVGQEDVSHVVQITVEPTIRRQNAGLHHVPQHINAFVFRQLDRPFFLHDHTVN